MRVVDVEKVIVLAKGGGPVSEAFANKKALLRNADFCSERHR